MKLIRDEYAKIIPDEKWYNETNKISQFQFIKAKIYEELEELQVTNFEDISEWGDLFEILSTMAEFKGYDAPSILDAQMQKYEKYGGFENFVILKSNHS